jgi:hypothetical protein
VLDAVGGAPTGGLIPRLKGEIVRRVIDKTEAAHGAIIAYDPCAVAYRDSPSEAHAGC